MGSSAEIREYVVSRGAALSRAAYLLTGDRHAAEDLVQETYVVMVRHWRRIDSHNPDPYVRRIMYSRFVDGWRRRRRLDEVATAEPAEPIGAAAWYPDDGAGVSDDRIVLRDALLRLTPKQRAMLVLRFYDDLSEVQTAQVLGVSPSTVKSQTRVALQRLRDLAPAALATFGPSVEEVLP
jgi:RNA polymerase sigma-70 factor (sigma-E family)